MSPAAHLPANEPERLRALKQLQVLDTPPHPALDALTLAAAQACGTPIALVSLIDEQRQWFKAAIGLGEVRETPRDWAFCAHAILSPDTILEVSDAQQDTRFANNPLVTGDPKIRFYAGAPLLSVEGQALGTLCVIDPQPKSLSEAQRTQLVGLAQATAMVLEQLRPEKQQLAAVLERLKLATAAANIGTWEYLIDQDTLYWDAPMLDLLGLTGREAPEQPRKAADWLARLHPEDREEAQRHLAVCAASPESEYRAQFRIVRPDGQSRHIKAIAHVHRDDQGRALRFLGVNWDVTEQQEAAQVLRHQARHDALTGLHNRAAFDEALQNAVDSARRGEGPHALLFVDLDDFKQVNDTCGHGTGDRVLQQIAQVLQSEIRSSDVLARVGGDEFGVILHDCDLTQAQRIGEALDARLRHTALSEANCCLSVGASVGIVALNQQSATAQAVLSAADQACYAAKRSARNQPRIAS